MDEYAETYSGTLPNALVLVPGTQAHRVTVNGLLVEEHRPELDAPIVYSYNGFGELMEVSSPQSGTTVYQRDELGRVSGMTAPGRGQENWTYRSLNSTASGEIASHTVWVVASGGGAAVPQRKYYQYDRLRRMTHLWGNAVPPQKFQYDGVGRLAFLTTYRQDDAAWLSSFFPTTAFAGNGDVTGWTYAGNGSRVASKVDAANNAVTYSYDTGGFLLARQWARRLPGTSTPMATFYSWQTLPGQPVRKVPGRLMQITYNDGLTAPVSHGYRRDGRVAWTQDESGLRTFTAPQPTGTAGQMAWSEQIDGASGLLRGLRLTNSGEHPGRPQSFSAKILTGTDFYQVHQTWDGLGRLEEVTFPTGEVAFTHLFGASHGGLQQVAATLTGAGASSTIYRHLDKPPSAGGHLTATYYTR